MECIKEWTRRLIVEVTTPSNYIRLTLLHRLVPQLHEEDSDKMAIIKSVAEDDVLFYWSMNSVDIEESHSAVVT